jgi:hypothetical protein
VKSSKDEVDCRGDERHHLVEGAWSRSPKERFQFRKRLFDGIEVRTVRWQKQDLRADGFDREADVRLFVHREVVEHHVCLP